MTFQELTDTQWERVERLLHTLAEGKVRGRPPSDGRAVLNGILYVLLTGSPWSKVPKHYVSSSTCWRRFKKWSEDGTWARVWPELLETFDETTKQQWAMALLQGYFFPCKLRERVTKTATESPKLHKKHKPKKT